MRIVASLLALLVSVAAHSQAALYSFEDPELDAEYRELIHSIRCMKCQNQSVAESPVDQAKDIQRLAYEMKAEGRSNGEIREYLIARYGDFISYQPPFKPSTWLLWAAPAIFLIGGGIIFARVLRTRMQQPLDEEPE